jgi:hypothetical protein
MDGENTKMGYAFLGKGTGLLVSELCFGLMTLSTDGAALPPLPPSASALADQKMLLMRTGREGAMGSARCRPGDLLSPA